MHWTAIVWGYIALLLAGGVMGFIKAGSRASLIASSAIALVLAALVLTGVPAVIVFYALVFLAIFFASRYFKSRRLMPGGIFAIVSALAAVAVWFLKS